MSVAMGKRGNSADPEVQEALLRILEVCKEFDVPCAVGATAADVERRIEQGFRIIMSPPRRVTDALDIGRQGGRPLSPNSDGVIQVCGPHNHSLARQRSLVS